MRSYLHRHELCARRAVLHEPTHVNERVVLAILTSAIRATVRFAKRISAEKPTFFWKMEKAPVVSVYSYDIFSCYECNLVHEKNDFAERCEILAEYRSEK